MGLTPEPETGEPLPAAGPAERAPRGPVERPREEANQAPAGERPGEGGEWFAPAFEEPAEMAEESAAVAQGAAGVGEGRAEVTEGKPARRRRKRRRKPREPGRVTADRPGAERADQISEAPVEELEESETAGEEDRPDRGRSKRRRKRPTPRKRKKRTSIADDAVAAQAEEGPTKPERMAAEAGESAELEVEEDEPAKGAGLSKAGHRAIPTWEEAIGLIISANLEARARSPSPGFSRGRGKGRGPSRTPGPRERPPEKRKR